jgi:hypothetical protein
MELHKEKYLHIVSFNIPYPPNYGGIIDVFYKVKAISKLGVKIYLHCFEYGRKHQPELNKYCEKVYYYKRFTGIRYSLNIQPYIVYSRSNDQLITRLLRDNHPVLFEGLHTTFVLNDSRLANRVRIVRMHNIEHDYYNNLAFIEQNVWKKIYFRIEAYKLKSYEAILNSVDIIAAISPKDFGYLNKTKDKYINIQHIPPFHPYEKIMSKTGKGNYIIYQGNLSVGENVKAVLFLVDNVFNRLNIPIIIAGRNPDAKIIRAVSGYKNISLKTNPSEKEMLDLILNAQINVLPTFQATGIKLKLLSALFIGRHCVTNSMMVENTGLENLCTIRNSPKGIIEAINKLFNIPFDNKLLNSRKNNLSKNYSNANNAEKLCKLF